MKKRQFLAPLAASISALLGGAALPAVVAIEPATAASAPTSQMLGDRLTLTRTGPVEMRLADHESHASHESHSSHSSHVSGN